MTWLITGGSGYIGSHVVQEFLSHGYSVLSLDLKEPHELFLSDSNFEFIQLDLMDFKSVENVFTTRKFEGVIHLAALKSVVESFEFESRYLDINYHATLNLAKIAKSNQISKFINTSSAAVYGNPTSSIVDESAKVNPISPYGATKYKSEESLRKMHQDSNFKSISLRYFNVIGAAKFELRDHSINNVVPIFLNALENDVKPTIFGFNLNTIDGTPVRDYIHVGDVAKINFLLATMHWVQNIPDTFNVGTGVGTSVKQIYETISDILGKKPGFNSAPLRAGEPEVIISNISLLKEYIAEIQFLSAREAIWSLFDFS